jgi:simple sugar transport system permease protein
MLEHLIPVLAGTLAAATPLIFAGLGELVAERSGVINLGVEGMMLIGAIAGFAAAADSGGGALAGLPAGAVAGALAALVFAVLSLSMAANQAACGLALTIFGIGLSAFIGQHYVSFSLPGLQPLDIPGLVDIPVLGRIFFHQDAVTYLALISFGIVWWVLRKTRLGLILKAVGEAPDAAHAIGYPVIAIRYGATLFGGVTILQFHAQGLGIAVPVQLLAALPYLATVVVLVLISRDKRLLQLNLPASLGKPWLP